MGVLVAFGVLIVLIYKKIPITVAAPVCAVLLAVLSGLEPFTTLTVDYMNAMVDFVRSYFLLFLISAIFGAAMDASGAAYSIGNWLGHKLGAKYAVWGVSLAAAVLAYGGISSFVLIFTIYPIALVLFQQANISRKLIPATIAAGCFTAPHFLWGSPDLCNVIPGDFLGTTVRSGPLVGMICAVFYFTISTMYVSWEARRMTRRGEHFVATESIQAILDEHAAHKPLSPAISAIPFVIIIITLNILKLDVTLAMLCGTLVCYILFWNQIDDKRHTLAAGAENAIHSTINTAMAVAIGNVAKLTNAFTVMVDKITGIGGSPYISFALATMIISGLCSSGVGGVTVSCGVLAERYLAMGVNAVALHKLATASSIVLTPTPWCGTVITFLTVCELNHKEAYKPIFVLGVLLAIVNMLLCLGLCFLIY